MVELLIYPISMQPKAQLDNVTTLKSTSNDNNLDLEVYKLEITVRMNIQREIKVHKS